jgi:hypothetical protein
MTDTVPNCALAQHRSTPGPVPVNSTGKRWPQELSTYQNRRACA